VLHVPQVEVGLRSRGFVTKVEAWWGGANPRTQPWQLYDDGPLLAVRVSFTGEKDPVVGWWYQVQIRCAAACHTSPSWQPAQALWLAVMLSMARQAGIQTSQPVSQEWSDHCQI